jgi:hypothetical protein
VNKWAIAAVAATVGYGAGVAGPALGQGAVGTAVNVPLKWEKQSSGTYEGKDIFAAQLQPDSTAEVVFSSQDSVWTLVHRTMQGTPENPTGRLVTCEVDLSDGVEPLSLRLRDLSGEYVLRTSAVPTVTWAPSVPNPFAAVFGGPPKTQPDRAPAPTQLAASPASVRACQTLDALRAFEASPAGQSRRDEAYSDYRMRCSEYLRARGFEDNVCFPQDDDNPHPVCSNAKRR